MLLSHLYEGVRTLHPALLQVVNHEIIYLLLPRQMEDQRTKMSATNQISFFSHFFFVK